MTDVDKDEAHGETRPKAADDLCKDAVHDATQHEDVKDVDEAQLEAVKD